MGAAGIRDTTNPRDIFGNKNPYYEAPKSEKEQADEKAYWDEVNDSDATRTAAYMKFIKENNRYPTAEEAKKIQAEHLGPLQKAKMGVTPAEKDAAAVKAMQPLDMADIVLRAAGKVKTTTGYAGSFLTGPAENPVDRAARKFSQEKLILDAAKLRGLK